MQTNKKNLNFKYSFIKQNFLLNYYFLTWIIINWRLEIVNSIGCFKCSSTSNNSTCSDPFNPGNVPEGTSLYEPNCQAGVQGRVGLFPARFCLKVSGYIVGTNDQIVIRTCTVTKLLDTDTSHSSFTLKLENGNDIQVQSGLIASCKEDGCNEAFKLISNKYFMLFYVLFLTLSHFI